MDRIIYTPKAALCFIINYEHELAKEEVWRKWIAPNADIINVYFYYADKTKIRSDWIREHAIPETYIKPTTYMNVMPAYLGITRAALAADEANHWIIYLTDFCAPIISPRRFRYLFLNYHDRTFMSWNPASWDVAKERRANLHLVAKSLRLANSPWFTLTRKHALVILQFIRQNPSLAETVFNGIVANESFFAIAFKHQNVINDVVAFDTHLSDWVRVSSSTSPHKFEDANPKDRAFIEDGLTKNPMAMFLRKVMPEFPDAVLEKYIYNWQHDADLALVVPNKWKKWQFRESFLQIAQAVAVIAICLLWVFYVLYFDNEFLKA